MNELSELRGIDSEILEIFEQRVLKVVESERKLVEFEGAITSS